jgi:hypothetical protein
MQDNQKEFLLKEYDKLNNEVAKLLEETRTREKYSLTIISLVAAWIYTEIIKYPKDNNIPKDVFIPIIQLLSWIPLVITFLYGISVLLIYKNIKWIGGYLSIIEATFINNLEYTEKDEKTGKIETKIFGWEKYFDEKNRKSYFVIWTWIFWILQIIIAIALIYKSYTIL